ncbi:hypothetical protein TSUD_23610 [Trifolium subterraneum]|uniref:Uncharacterized protein n=1 Tax=Trifolium subterraneum TaxID=3900 RepID=A0A2Z6LWW4_TRISU|nr:hypothetical protein TSUD_23610 [Trifolium subterraneum]
MRWWCDELLHTTWGCTEPDLNLLSVEPLIPYGAIYCSRRHPWFLGNVVIALALVVEVSSPT